MEIILLKNYEGLGEAGDVVSVKPGFARNKLIPEGVALRASKRNMAIAHEKKKNENTRQVRAEAAHDALVKTLSKTEIQLKPRLVKKIKCLDQLQLLTFINHYQKRV